MDAFAFRDTCICHALREAARRVSRRYSEALRPVGLNAGQFSLLASLSGPDPIPQHRVADLLGLDRTTLSRELRPLERRGLVVAAPGERDKRVRCLSLTPAGRALFAEAVPLWERAQRDSADRLNPERWPDLKQALNSVSR